MNFDLNKTMDFDFSLVIFELPQIYKYIYNFI